LNQHIPFAGAENAWTGRFLARSGGVRIGRKGEFPVPGLLSGAKTQPFCRFIENRLTEIGIPMIFTIGKQIRLSGKPQCLLYRPDFGDETVNNGEPSHECHG
jgi:hypothetical protein